MINPNVQKSQAAERLDSRRANLWWIGGGPGEGAALPGLRRCPARRSASAPWAKNVATLLNNLALLYQAQGRYDEALPLRLEVNRIQERALGRDHPQFAIGLYNTALLYWAQGKKDDANRSCKEAIGIVERALGSDRASNDCAVPQRLGRL